MKRYLLLFLCIPLLTQCYRSHYVSHDKTVFRYNEASGITSLDPAFAKDLANIWPCNQLYNGLVQLNDDLEPVPGIADRWEISDDGRTYTFYLRRDVKFHNHHIFKDSTGRRVVAADVLYSFNRILNPSTASPGAWVFSNVAQYQDKPAFNALNDSVFEIRLTKPFPPFLGILSMKYCSIVPWEVVEYYGEDFRKNPVGTGPFRFQMWKEGVKLVLVKNEDYFEFDGDGRMPHIDALAVSFQLDKQSAFLEFVKGNLDFLSGIDPAYKDEVLTRDGKLKEKYSDRFYLLSIPYLNTEYLGMLVDTSLESSKNNPFNNKSVRKAMNWAIDRQKMAKHLRNNLITPGKYGLLPPGLKAFDTTGLRYGYDPDMAMHLLAKAGYPNGNGLPTLRLYTTSDYLDLFKFLQYQYAEIGINIEIEVTPYATLKELKAQGKVNFFRASWIADYPDGENYLSLFCSWNFAPSGPNYTRFANTRYDSLYLLSQEVIHDSVRFALYREMNTIIMEEAPIIILYYDQVVRLVSNNVKGLGINPLNMLDLRKVRINHQWTEN